MSHRKLKKYLKKNPSCVDNGFYTVCYENPNWKMLTKNGGSENISTKNLERFFTTNYNLDKSEIYNIKIGDKDYLEIVEEVKKAFSQHTSLPDYTVKLYQSKNTWGECHFSHSTIYLNELLKDATIIKSVLAHELIHSLYISGHGKDFMRMVDKVNKLGFNVAVDRKSIPLYLKKALKNVKLPRVKVRRVHVKTCSN